MIRLIVGKDYFHHTRMTNSKTLSHLINKIFGIFSNIKFPENPKFTRGVVPSRQTETTNQIYDFLN